jgi:hypothetical protein
MRITPDHVERAFRRIDDFYSVQGWEADPPATEEDVEQSVDPVVALLASVGLTVEAALAFRRHSDDGDLIGLLVGVLARELAEDDGDSLASPSPEFATPSPPPFTPDEQAAADSKRGQPSGDQRRTRP